MTISDKKLKEIQNLILDNFMQFLQTTENDEKYNEKLSLFQNYYLKNTKDMHYVIENINSLTMNIEAKVCFITLFGMIQPNYKKRIESLFNLFRNSDKFEIRSSAVCSISIWPTNYSKSLMSLILDYSPINNSDGIETLIERLDKALLSSSILCDIGENGDLVILENNKLETVQNA